MKPQWNKFYVKKKYYFLYLQVSFNKKWHEQVSHTSVTFYNFLPSNENMLNSLILVSQKFLYNANTTLKWQNNIARGKYVKKSHK